MLEPEMDNFAKVQSSPTTDSLARLAVAVRAPLLMVDIISMTCATAEGDYMALSLSFIDPSWSC
jgi:hypothetical protein